jgi:1,2-diacylglycerol 3-alpha-glucosyltransferase
MSKSNQKSAKVFLVFSRLDNANRGFKSFIQECFEILSKEPLLDITLFKGGGETQAHSITLSNISRNSWLTKQLEKFTIRGAYFIEEVSFFLSLLLHIYHQKPNIIYFSDRNVGNLLWHWRRLTKQYHKMIHHCVLAFSSN